MDIIIGARGHPKKFNVPHGSQDEAKDDNAPGKYRCGAGASPAKKLSDRQEVHDARKRQRGHEVRSTPIAEVA
jgi:hypothetical protein